MALKPTRARRSKVEVEQEFATLVEHFILGAETAVILIFGIGSL